VVLFLEGVNTRRSRSGGVWWLFTKYDFICVLGIVVVVSVLSRFFPFTLNKFNLYFLIYFIFTWFLKKETENLNVNEVHIKLSLI
jgi:hypothetical protein